MWFSRYRGSFVETFSTSLSDLTDVIYKARMNLRYQFQPTIGARLDHESRKEHEYLCDEIPKLDIQGGK
jgi:hypothetical protein